MLNRSPKEVYRHLYRVLKKHKIKCGMDEDMASRKANIYAVKHAWKVFVSLEEDKR